MKNLLIGTTINLLILIISFIIKSEKLFIYGTQIMGFGCIGIGAILSGLMSDNIYRRTAVEDETERTQRLMKSSDFILFGVPSIIILIIYYFFIK